MMPFYLGPTAILAHSISKAVVETLETNGGRLVQLVRLPCDEKWPFLDSGILFARDFYQSFYDTYVGIYKEGSKLIVCGTPGIGNSAFGCYCIYRALMDRKRVVYRTSKHGKWLVYDRYSVSELSEMPSELLRDFKNVVYISDAISPFEVPCPTILITSPKKIVWFEFNKARGCEMKWFGIWDRDNELDLLRHHCFPSITFNEMDKQVQMWGAVPRITLSRANVFTESNLKYLVQASAPDLLIKAAMITETGTDDSNHRLVHIIPDNNFDAVSRSFASTHVADLIYSHFKGTSSDRLQLFLSDLSHVSEAKSATGVLFGMLFERHSREVIAMGGSFQVRDLHSGETRTAVLDISLGLMEFDSAEKITQCDGKLYTPKSKRHTAIDFLTWNTDALQLFNSTSNTNHDVIMDSADGKSGVYRFVSTLPSGNYRNEFYFAVPCERFLKMSYPKLLWKESTRSTLAVKRPTEVEKQSFQKLFKFYAISIPIGKRMLSSLRRIV